MRIYFQTFLVTVVLKRVVVAGGGYMPRNVCLKIRDNMAYMVKVMNRVKRN